MHRWAEGIRLCWRGGGWILFGLILGWGVVCGHGAALDSARQFWATGDYARCIALAEAGVRGDNQEEEWQLLLTRALLVLGRYEDSRNAITNALARWPRSIRLRWLAREVWLANGQPAAAASAVKEIKPLVAARPWAYRSSPDLVAFGRALLWEGADPKLVLERVYSAAKQMDESLPEVHLARGELALEKSDYALAAEVFQEGLKKLPKDPDLHWGLARAYEPSDRAQMIRSLDAALEHNAQHLPSLLTLADHHIDAENYDEAEKLLDRVRSTNPWHPEAWAYRAVLAHLKSDGSRAQVAREMGLRFWPSNPRVDHLIGLKLSQKYRFAEGARHQRQALQFDPDYLPAKAQLAQDCLRLGEESEGWRLAREVQDQDGYNVAACNLVTLQDTLEAFLLLTNQHFQVRMSAREGSLYGTRVLALLEEARTRLSAKYGLEITRPVLVEMFSDQRDFAVRTFGMPENNGFLGVCFGHVITANSPASRPGQRFNWEAMLWHEFCHVITLRLTGNKIPRWLSEGISVYEERQANQAWGQHMVPRYREMILDGKMTPLSQLSGAFLAPPSDLHLQFAYYQSSLAVEFLVDHFGQERLLSLLRDLGEGAELNRALEKHTAPLAKIDRDFAAYARRAAEQMAPGLSWERPALDGWGMRADEQAWLAWAKLRPSNYWVMTREAERRVEARQWAEAKAVLEPLVVLYPGATGADSPYRKLAAVHRALGETDQERQVLARFAEWDGEAVDAYLRLMELGAEARDWAGVVQNGNRYLAVDPLVPVPYRFLAEAHAGLGQPAEAVKANEALLLLDPANPAEIHLRLARLLHPLGESAGARRHLLQALEDTPRDRAALRFLLELNAPARTAAATAAPATPAPAHSP
jgi:tetratricopeptide (TPR) repeat protein